MTTAETVHNPSPSENCLVGRKAAVHLCLLKPSDNLFSSSWPNRFPGRRFQLRKNRWHGNPIKPNSCALQEERDFPLAQQRSQAATNVLAGILVASPTTFSYDLGCRGDLPLLNHLTEPNSQVIPIFSALPDRQPWRGVFFDLGPISPVVVCQHELGIWHIGMLRLKSSSDLTMDPSFSAPRRARNTIPCRIPSFAMDQRRGPTCGSRTAWSWGGTEP